MSQKWGRPQGCHHASCGSSWWKAKLRRPGPVHQRCPSATKDWTGIKHVSGWFFQLGLAADSHLYQQLCKSSQCGMQSSSSIQCGTSSSAFWPGCLPSCISDWTARSLGCLNGRCNSWQLAEAAVKVLSVCLVPLSGKWILLIYRAIAIFGFVKNINYAF